MVKKSKEAATPELRSKTRRIARQITPDIADRACVITERDLDAVEVDNARLLHASRVPDHGADAAVRRVVARINGAAKIGDLVEQAGFSGRGFRAVVRLLRSHELELVNHERITRSALVRRRNV
jgi:hypothetical protein